MVVKIIIGWALNVSGIAAKPATLRSGTALEWSKLPYHYWIYATAFIASRKKPISEYEMQRLLGHKFYEPIWTMMHKLRLTMGHCEALYKLDGLVEADEQKR